MQCHENLMNRRRKKANAKKNPSITVPSAPTSKEKALPSLPVSALERAADVPAVDTSRATSPNQRPGNASRDLSPLSDHRECL